MSSQLVDRGIPVTPSRPALQGALSWNTPTGWSVAVSGASEANSPGRLVEALAQVARSWSLSTDWQMQASLVQYRYGSGSRYRLYDRYELGANGIYRDVLTVGVSAAQLTHAGRGPRFAADVGFQWPLVPQLALSAGAGTSQYLVPPREYGHRPRRYGYGHLGLVWNNGPWRLDVNRMVTDDAPRPRGAGNRVSPWVATLARSF